MLTFSLPIAAQFLALVVLAVAGVLPDQDAPSADLSTLWPTLGHALVGGALSEEFIVVAAPLVLLWTLFPRLRCSRRLFVVLVVTLVGARLAYHVYQGVGVLQHPLWAYVSVAVFAAFGRVWFLIAGHAAFNTVVVLGGYDLPGTGELFTLLILVVFFLVCWGLYRYAEHEGTTMRSAFARAVLTRRSTTTTNLSPAPADAGS